MHSFSGRGAWEVPLLRPRHPLLPQAAGGERQALPLAPRSSCPGSACPTPATPSPKLPAPSRRLSCRQPPQSPRTSRQPPRGPLRPQASPLRSQRPHAGVPQGPLTTRTPPPRQPSPTRHSADPLGHFAEGVAEGHVLRAVHVDRRRRRHQGRHAGRPGAAAPPPRDGQFRPRGTPGAAAPPHGTPGAVVPALSGTGAVGRARDRPALPSPTGREQPHAALETVYWGPPPHAARGGWFFFKNVVTVIKKRPEACMHPPTRPRPREGRSPAREDAAWQPTP